MDKHNGSEPFEVSCDTAPNCPGFRCLDGCLIVALADPFTRAQILREAEEAIMREMPDAS